jgi:hopanoid biosynthesis associated protein HpnK
LRGCAQLVKKIQRPLIVSADDFGLSLEVNEAVERAHREGVLRAASLMVAAPQADDAVARARRLPALRVGLHLVLVNGRPMLPPQQLPAIVDAQGHFFSDLGRAGVRFFFARGARQQLEAEIRAQFEAYAATGLRLDHVNAQNHMHVHPTILSLILKIGPQYGLRAVRVPREPFWASWRAARTDLVARLSNAALLWPWLRLMQQRLKRAGIRTNDFVFGMNDSGRMAAPRVLRILLHLPRGGLSELYFHPATGPWPGMDAAMAGYDFAGELAALTSSEVLAAMRTGDLEPVGYSELAAPNAN